MGRIAETVFTDPSDIARLERWVEELAVNARVRVHIAEGPPVEGVVMVTPTVQVFKTPSDGEGINGVVNLEDPRRPGWSVSVWLGDILDVEHMDSVVMGTSKA
ncbi:DUF3247 family protein [Luteibacter yeojuensis]|uniref:DUF3247 family protein n=1 Tax=Luteibacter yeojuensis TaxID=345309 RepID=A0A7X5QSF1_9GAMM|nr:DUF3247 family protein [Luteibacter yeojuensis]NID14561.1 DUF3247 family protein [Luteibacter yeojuensis]